MNDLKLLSEKANKLDLHVLYVEDDKILLETTSSILSHIFKNYDRAENGKVGLDKYKEKKYDIIITDINMPIMDGIEMIEEITKENPDPPAVIVTSAYNESKYLSELINMGITYFLFKPVNPSKLIQILLNVATAIGNEKELEDYKHNLEEKVREQTKSIRKINNDLEIGLRYEKILSDIALMVNSRIDVEDMEKEILDKLPSITKIAKGAIYRFNSKSDCFEVSSQTETENKLPKKIYYSNIPNTVIKLLNSKMVVTNDTTQLNLTEKKFFDEYRVKSLCAFPIEFKGNTEGVLILYTDRVHRWEERKFNLLQSIASMIANSWEKDRVYKEKIEEEKKRADAVKVAENSSRLASIGTLASGIAHEINQPLNAIKVTIDGMLFYWERKQPSLSDIHENIQFISEETKRIDRIIMHMRELVHAEKRKNPELMNVNDTINNCLGMVRNQLKNHNINLNTEFSDNVPQIYGFPTQFEQVITNLVNNARDALDSVNQKEKEIKVITEKIENGCKITVSDNGSGISDENLLSVFDPFFSTKSKKKGMGMGLSITQNIVVGLGGTIRAENNESCGASFIVELPVGRKL